MAGKFILDRVKEHFGGDDEDYSDGFPDMNYLIGVSTGMDVGEFPTPMDERIGYAAMVGGSVTELQITNPATFTLERDQMVSTINQLGLDVTTHPDMNAGFCTAEKSARGEEYGYDTIEQYFTNYLQELAQFKKHVEKLGEGDEPLFQIGRINPHISTSPMPALNERMANDVGVDPFGYEINNYDEDSRKQRNYRGENIYKNPEFLRKLYHILFLELSNYPFQQYQTFASYSNRFDEEWLRARHIAAWKFFDEETDGVSDKLGTILTARQQDQGINRSWRELIDNGIDLEESISFYTPDIETNRQGLEQEVTAYNGIESVEEYNDLGSALVEIFSEDALQIRRLDNILFGIENLTVDQLKKRNAGDYDDQFTSAMDVDVSEVKEILLSGLNKALDRLWYPNTHDPNSQNISQEAKWQSLQSHLEIENIRLFENAYEIGKNSDQMEVGIEKLAEDVFSGENADDYFDENDRENLDNPEEMHEDMIERILSSQQFQREMWKESIIFYHILPAWMSSSEEVEDDYHEGWSAPKFIWESIVVDKWGEKDNVNLDLENPRNGVYEEDSGDDVYHYLDLLEDNREFQRDVAAAVGACYAWGHFTQRKAQFDLKNRDFGLTNDEAEEVENDGWTWIRWMNKFGIGVNLETMAGSPQMRFKVWRPKDIAVAAHAINLTTREMFNEEELNDEIDGRPAKFTIDMEHVASLGAPPLDEMERFWKQEERLAENRPELELDKDKPISTILRQMHLMDPGVDAERGTHHNAFERGNMLLYEWLYKFVKNGFARNENEASTVLFELAEHNDESSYMMKITMNLIELGVKPEDLDPNRVDPGEEPEDEEEALIARFFGMEQLNYAREWAKIEEHAFDPLQGLLEAEPFDYTYSSRAATDNENRPQEWQAEEYQ